MPCPTSTPPGAVRTEYHHSSWDRQGGDPTFRGGDRTRRSGDRGPGSEITRSGHVWALRPGSSPRPGPHRRPVRLRTRCGTARPPPRDAGDAPSHHSRADGARLRAVRHIGHVLVERARVTRIVTRSPRVRDVGCDRAAHHRSRRRVARRSRTSRSRWRCVLGATPAPRDAARRDVRDPSIVPAPVGGGDDRVSRRSERPSRRSPAPRSRRTASGGSPRSSTRSPRSSASGRTRCRRSCP